MDIEDIVAIPDLNRWLAERDLRGFWEREIDQTEFKPHLWKWDNIYAGLMKAIEVVAMDQTGIQTGRRNIGLRIPSLGGRGTPTISLGAQCLLPGEVALAHKHTPSAIRFVIKGTPGAYTVVEGEPIPMAEGDLITTPQWTWHDHYNERQRARHLARCAGRAARADRQVLPPGLPGASAAEKQARRLYG